MSKAPTRADPSNGWTSFEDFAASYSRELRRLCWALTGDPGLGEDLAQETLARVWRAWSRVDGNPVAYTKRTAVNQSISWKRRAWRNEIATDGPAHDDLLGREPISEDDVAADRIDVERLLRSLPPKYRSVVVARFLFDMSIDETAELFGCSLGTVKSRTSRALSKIRDQLQDTPTQNPPIEDPLRGEEHDS